jgi:3-hydroxyisobutyrate dehydrogenase
MKVAVVGVGAMGRAMTGHLVAAGHAVSAHDVDATALRAAAEAGARPAASLADAAGDAEIAIVVVATDRQVEAVVRGLAEAARGALIAVAATCHPHAMQALAAEAEAAGLRLIDAPVCHGLQGALEGRLVSLCGGRAEDVDAARPVLGAYSRAVHHVGPIGAGQLAKTCNNLLHWAACVANYEALLLARRFGVPGQRMREILMDCPGANGTLERWDGARFTWHEKDMDVALDLAQAGGLTLPLFGQVDQLVKTLGPDMVRELLHGQAAHYLGRRYAALAPGQGGLA